MKETLICLDLSTTCTGIAIFDIKSKKLLKYYSIKPNTKGLSKLETLEVALIKIKDLTTQLDKIIKDLNPKIIVIEQINKGISRLGQKTLDMLHGSVLFAISDQRILNKVIFLDTIAWRGGLGLRLSDEDKKFNRDLRKSIKKNKKLKLDIVTPKTLAIRYVKKVLNIQLDAKDHDIAEAICLGLYFLNKK